MSERINGRYRNIQGDSGAVQNMLMAMVETVSAERRYPTLIQTASCDYQNLGEREFVWFGHSSLLLKLAGLTILIDPCFQDIPLYKRFNFSNPVRPEALPDIDVLLISHNHQDHLHLPTLRSIAGKVKRVVCPLDNYVYIQSIFPRAIVSELDWSQSFGLPGLTITAVPAHHYSRVGLTDRCAALWCGYVLNDVYYSGDSGWSEEVFKSIRRSFPSLGCCFVEMGQYNARWRSNHMFPEETRKACDIVGGRQCIPIHWGAYALSVHPWDETLQRCREGVLGRFFIPQIGQAYGLAAVESAPGNYIALAWELSQ